MIYSISSALGRGLLPSNIQLIEYIAIPGVVEGIFALFLEAMLIATFARRFLEG
jgi:hypothetical protein